MLRQEARRDHGDQAVERNLNAAAWGGRRNPRRRGTHSGRWIGISGGAPLAQRGAVVLRLLLAPCVIGQPRRRTDHPLLRAGPTFWARAATDGDVLIASAHN